MYSIRIVSSDFYTSPPISGLDVMYSEFRGSSIHQVPVIRIFGSSTSGHKTCLHVHGVFPYLYIPYDGKQSSKSLLYQIAASLDKSINISLGQTSSNTQHVYKISLVSGIPMYGYHARKHQFLKIYFYNPLILKKACTLLQNGAVLNVIYQPHEAHLPYVLQFMIDFNLHGMSLINVSELRYRHGSNIPPGALPEDLLLPSSIQKISVCEREADVLAEHILNRLEVANGEVGTNPGIKALWEDERQRRRVGGENSQISQCLTQSRPNDHPTGSHVTLKQALIERLLILDGKPLQENSSPNVSVYAAETPSSQSLLDASTVESHSPFTPQNLTMDESFAEDEPSVIFDDDAQELLNALCDLNENARDLEEDSILSQKPKEAESDEELDLSMPLASLTTPIKLDVAECSEENILNDSFFDKSFQLPQLDGCYSDEEVVSENNLQHYKKQNASKNAISEDLADVKTNDFKTQEKVDICKYEGRITRSQHKGTMRHLQNLGVSQQCTQNLDQPKARKRKAVISKFKITEAELPYKYEPGGKLLEIIYESRLPNLNNNKSIQSKMFDNNLNLINNSQISNRVAITNIKHEESDTTPELKTQVEGRITRSKSKGSIAISAASNPPKSMVNILSHKILGKHEMFDIDQLFPKHTLTKCSNISKNTQNRKATSQLLVDHSQFKKQHNPNVHSVSTENLGKHNPETSFGEIGDFKAMHKLQDYFTNTLPGLVENRNISACKILRTIKENETSLKQKLMKTGDTSKPNFMNDVKYNLQFLDGPNDSSSSDESQQSRASTRKPRRRTLKMSQTATNYTPLKVEVHSPQKTGTSGGLSRDSSAISLPKTSFSKPKKLTSITKKENPIRDDQTNQRLSPILLQKKRRDVAKRQLNLDCEGVTALNKTVIFEELMCRHTPSKSKCSKEEMHEPICDKQQISNTNITANKQHLNLDTKLSGKSDGSADIFATPEDQREDVGVGVSSDLNVVCKYDLGNNFVPRPGPSKNVASSASSLDAPNLTTKLWTPKYKAPTRLDIVSTMHEHNIPSVHNVQPFYSCSTDVTGSVEIGRRILKLSSNTTADFPEFETIFKGLAIHRKAQLEALCPNLKLSKAQILDYKLQHCSNRDIVITPAKLPPTKQEVQTWMHSLSRHQEVVVSEKSKKKILIPCSPGMNNADGEDDSLTLTPCTPAQDRDDALSELDSVSATPKSSKTRNFVLPNISNTSLNNSCQITGVSLDNTHGFKASMENYQEVKVLREYQYLTVLVMEVHVQTRGDLKPNPEVDEIRAIFYTVTNDVADGSTKFPSKTGVIVVGKNIDYCNVNEKFDIKYVENEAAAINHYAESVLEWDPDIFVGYELELLSWGYLINRGYKLEINLLKQLSRVPGAKLRSSEDQCELKITGRIILDFWRLLKHEIALQSYTFENVVYHLLHQRLPLYSFKDLSYWWEHPHGLYFHKTVDYYLTRLQGILKLLDNLDLIDRTSELARLFGIQFYEVLSRGSQFRVESMMLRLAKPLNYIPVSPSVQQRANMRAPESLPLILEPESKFYADPVIVLDFQSLYPSIIIAYNYCFTTCLGKIEHLGRNAPFEFGASQLRIGRSTIKKLLNNDKLHFSPCGAAFVKSEIRRGILPRMLQEILDTRLMVKKSLKKAGDNKTLRKVLHSRQLGLKLIANVTYGYTAANFSGRMPSVEVGDSVVSKGRETLQRAINLVEKTPEWGARVVYGDTDSLFVVMPGKSKEEAFKVGAEIADAVTNDNPSPVKLKLEKVYQPCILQTKKRYVGYKYEAPGQKLPEFEAKGIETVRRDGCPAVAKMLEKCLRMLFDTRDVSLVKKYVCRQFNKILLGRVSIQDLTFAKEYRGASGYRPGACVPAFELAKKWKAVDKCSEPRSGQRVPYVIVNGPPGLPLIRLVRSPYELLSDASLRPNVLYYITKVIIPPINRCFTLIGADLNTWFNAMPRRQILQLPTSSTTKHKKSTISQYFSTTSCASCALPTHDGLCSECVQKPYLSMVLLQDKARNWEQSYHEIKKICQSCTKSKDELKCISLDCPVYYRICQAERDVQQTVYVRDLMSMIPEDEF